eukprot:TRINITY_DN4101_c0_g2_i1.p1 TRINITY_DN4101_c0_g2~~TRINITY_DN4101_c0_g2_i1.p1  ORF type:complete len:672 (-),score=43.21 TRINITY_DN4101_c0_g2_i1:271-2286(-)
MSLTVSNSVYRLQRVHQRNNYGQFKTVTRRRINILNCEGVNKTENGKADKLEGPSTDLRILRDRLRQIGLPYWMSSEEKDSARLRLFGVLALTLGTTGVSVLFNFLGRDFFNALSEKNAELFTTQLFKYLGGFVIGIPVFVFRDFYQSKLVLEWREWMTKQFLEDYLDDRTFYRIQAGSLVDNPDQRIANDIRSFTDIALGLLVVLLNAVVDLVSFSGILYGIYPPLFVALIIYAVGGTVVSVLIGQKLVGLNFIQEATEADFRYSLVRLRENAESIAFYGGEDAEGTLVLQRFGAVVQNYMSLIIQSRNLQFFTSFYRFLIQLLPAAVVAPLYFSGKIEFGVINQSASAFNHILTDVSLIVYQFENLAAFSAVVDRLGEAYETLQCKGRFKSTAGTQKQVMEQRIQIHDLDAQSTLVKEPSVLLQVKDLSLLTPDYSKWLVKDLKFQVEQGKSVLIMGPSGAGKTSLLRAIAGIWDSGSGEIVRYGKPISCHVHDGEIMFVPQKPYVVLGTLRDQLLYPAWASSVDNNQPASRPKPQDSQLVDVLNRVRLEGLLSNEYNQNQTNPLDVEVDWDSMLSVGEQQRLAFARILLTKPKLVLMDESTSALDLNNEKILYSAIKEEGITVISVGHRNSLKQFHEMVLNVQPLQDGNGNNYWQLQTVDQSNSVQVG